MDDSALAHLASSVTLESLYEPSEIQKSTDEGYDDFIWDVMVDEAREGWKTFSYFIVTKSRGRRTEELFVSGDCPAAEVYFKSLGVSGEAMNKSSAQVSEARDLNDNQ